MVKRVVREGQYPDVCPYRIDHLCRQQFRLLHNSPLRLNMVGLKYMRFTKLQFIYVVSDVSLTIIKQPEQQHRARYQTEGSRGAVKDREGNGFPIVQLLGYYQPTTLQVINYTINFFKLIFFF